VVKQVPDEPGGLVSHAATAVLKPANGNTGDVAAGHAKCRSITVECTIRVIVPPSPWPGQREKGAKLRKLSPYCGENPEPGKDVTESLTPRPELENGQDPSRT
jgi:hypothetical protein